MSRSLLVLLLACSATIGSQSSAQPSDFVCEMHERETFAHRTGNRAVSLSAARSKTTEIVYWLSGIWGPLH